MSTLQRIILWHDPHISGTAFAFGFIVLLALSFYSVLEVLTCIAIPSLVVTITMRMLHNIKCFVLKSPNHHPYQMWLDNDWSVKDKNLDSINRMVADFVNLVLDKTKAILLVQNIFASLQGLVVLYVWYYIGRNISGLTLLFISYISIFTIPKLLEHYKKEVKTLLKGIACKYKEYYNTVLNFVPKSMRSVDTNNNSKKKYVKNEEQEAPEKNEENNKEKKDD